MPKPCAYPKLKAEKQKQHKFLNRFVKAKRACAKLKKDK